MQRAMACLRVLAAHEIGGVRQFGTTLGRAAAEKESKVSNLLRSAAKRANPSEFRNNAAAGGVDARAPRPRPTRQQAAPRVLEDTHAIAAVLEKSTPVSSGRSANPLRKMETRYVLHCLFMRNNMHLTLAAEYRDVANPYSFLQQEIKMSKSTGHVGFKKAARGEVEAAYRLTVQFFNLMVEKGFTDKPLEVILRNYSKQRRSFLSVLTGKEGSRVRQNINKVTDGTRLRHGGVRPPAKRRL